MKRTLAILSLVALAMWAMKRYYTAATVDELQWILGPTATLVTALTGVGFEWEPGQGYLSRERFFLIAKACAGINFMIAAFGMMAFVRGRRVTSCRAAAGILLMCVLASYSAAVCVNAARIAVAMWLAAHPAGFAGMTAAQVHRVEGIACYFGGLVLLYQLVQYADRPPSHRAIPACFGGQAPPSHRPIRACFGGQAPELVPLFWYLVITVAVPVANGAASGGKLFVEHTLFVIAVPLALVALAAGGRQLVRAVRRPT
jgi:exosortase K